MTVQRVEVCTFCRGLLTLTVGDETIICPAHAELHTAEGFPSYSVAQVVSGDITIGHHPELPLSVRLALIMVAAVTLWGLVVLAVMNPTAGFLAACAAAVIIFSFLYRDEDYR